MTAGTGCHTVCPVLPWEQGAWTTTWPVVPLVNPAPTQVLKFWRGVHVNFGWGWGHGAQLPSSLVDIGPPVQ